MSVGDLLRTLSLTGNIPSGLTWDGSTFWVYDEGVTQVHQINPYTGATLRSFAPGIALYTDIAWVSGKIVQGTYSTRTLKWYDPYAGALLRTLSVTPFAPQGVAWDGHNLWIQASVTDVIRQINPYTGATLRSFAAPSDNGLGLGWDGHTLWHCDRGMEEIYQLDPYTGAVLRVLTELGFEPGAPEVVLNTLWVTDDTFLRLHQLALN